MADELTLKTGGRLYSPWKEISVSMNIERCAGNFRLGVSERWPGLQEALKITAGETCEILLGTDRVMTGYIDAVEKRMRADAHDVAVSGRDATADLVDCSAVRKPGQWKGLKVEQLAAELASPFNVAVKTEVDTGKPLTTFALQEGETVHCAVERAARMRGLLLTSNGRGELVITRPGNARIFTTLKLGANLLSISVVNDLRDRFSKYIAKGQTSGVAWDGQSVAAKASVARLASQLVAIATDPDVRRYRPTVLLAEQQDAALGLRDRVHWEASVRAARSLEIEVEVQGWRHQDGLWAPNRIVWLNAPELGVDADLLIVSVDFGLDERGTTTRLRLTRQDAYSVLPLKEQVLDRAGFTRGNTAQAARQKAIAGGQ